jgi:signal transduction histidine kinase
MTVPPPPDPEVNAALAAVIAWAVPNVADDAVCEIAATADSAATSASSSASANDRCSLRLPLQTNERLLGTLSLGAHHPIDLPAAEALAARAALSLENAELRAQVRRERADAQAARARVAFLAEASRLFAESLKLEPTLATVARLCVPALADWSAVVIVPDGLPQRVAVESSDPKKTALAKQMLEGYHIEPNARTGISEVIRTGQPAFLSVVPPDFAETASTDDFGRKLLRSIGLRSFICVPLVALGHSLGALSLGITESDRRFTATDLEFALEIGRRAGVALENARLYSVAREAIELRDQFLSVASHELKTPITALSLNLESIQRLGRVQPEAMAAKLTERIPTILQQMKRLNGLVERLLDVSQLAEGRLPLVREEVDAAELVQEVVSRFADSPIALTVSQGLIGQWDRLRVDQVLTNLIDNALKYSRGQAVQVSVTGLLHSCVFRVRDQGIGIAPKDQERVFARYERAAPLHQYSGLGLGLWITQQIVLSHGGQISIESTLGQGSTFIVELPFRTDVPPT